MLASDAYSPVFRQLSWLTADGLMQYAAAVFGMENEHDYKAEIHKEFPTWKQHSEMTSDHAYLVEGDFLQRRFRVQSTASGMTLMKAIQQEFYTPQSKGCQVRRETQSKFSLSCQEVRAVFSETKLEVVVDVKVPEDEAEMRAAKKNMQRVDLLGASKR